MIDSENGVVIISDVDREEVQGAMADPEFLRGRSEAWVAPVQRALASWAEDTKSNAKRRTIFDRDKYVTPGLIFEQMAMSEEAMDDDVVAGVYDTTEAMAFKKMVMESDDLDQSDVWNQIARDIDLDSFLRIVWRELFKNSQYFGVVWWGPKKYKVSGKREQREARKTFNIVAPVSVGVLDPTRVIPVGNTLFGDHGLAWIASESEVTLFNETKGGKGTQTDELVDQLILGPYVPNNDEAKQLKVEGVPVDRLYLLNPLNTWMGSLTKSTYERWARLRMKSLLPLLDLKHQLREMDRAFLLGGINFIVLVKKGTDTHPVKRTEEITMVTEQMRAQSKSSVIVSDHRLEIEIITPDLTNVLNTTKYAVLDDRIRLRLYGSISGGGAGTKDTELTLAKVVALGIENRRHMIKRDIERAIVRPTKDRNVGTFEASASMEYSPRRVDLLFDPEVAGIFQEIRDRGDLSRETLLDEFGFDIDLERQRRNQETKVGDDKVFKPVNVPFDSPNKVTPSGSGRKAATTKTKPTTSKSPTTPS